MDKSNQGFTFIEVIIVLSILTLLSTIALASYGNFNQRKRLDKEVSQFKEIFEVAKKKIVASDKSITSSGVDYSTCDLGSYKIDITSSSSYALRANVCDNSGSCPLSSGCSDITLSTYVIAAPITVSPTGQVLFDPIDKTVSGISSLTFTHGTLNQSTIVTIEPGGVIY